MYQDLNFNTRKSEEIKQYPEVEKIKVEENILVLLRDKIASRTTSWFKSDAKLQEHKTCSIKPTMICMSRTR